MNIFQPLNINRSKPNHSYFVVMVDYGRKGMEAIVDPEITRRGVIEKVREIIGDGNEIAFIHHITMNELPADVTVEMINEAQALRLEAAE